MVNKKSEMENNIFKGTINLPRLLIKTIILLILIVVISTLINIDSISKISFYNLIFNGRVRLPFGENSAQSYNLTLNNLDAMFASHIVSGQEKTDEEFRIIVIGDSSTWGILLRPNETLSALIETGLPKCNGKKVSTFNLGYPTLSLTKDLMIMEYAMRYNPDLIIWPLTLESFPNDKQIANPLVENNIERIRLINQEFGLASNMTDTIDENKLFIDRSLIGRRKEFADLIRLQFFGFLWSATGIDQSYPIDFPKAKNDLENTIEYHGMLPADDLVESLAFSVLDSMVYFAGDIPIIFINEPIMISNGSNSDVRYNFYYPIWAYDTYRRYLGENMKERGWKYLDVWNLIPNKEFTNSAIHLSPEGERMYSREMINYLNETICNEN